MATVTLTHVNKTYDNGVEAVHDLNLQIADGEFMVLVGPSGCGKTTALRMVAGLEKITAGEVAIGERVVNDLEPKDRDIAMVFQNYALYPHMTVRGNIGFALKVAGVSKAEIAGRVDRAAGILGLTEWLDRKPAQLSGGQRQRVAMGRAIVREPTVFLMDEPLSNLDAKLRVQTRAEVSRIQHELGVSTVYVTHDQVEAMTMGDRVAVMSAGHLAQCNSPYELYERPANLFVASFIGSPSMNLFRATLAAGAEKLHLGSQTVALPEALRRERPGLAAYAERELIVGLRPEHLQFLPGREGDNTVTVDVDLVEQLGSEQIIHFRADAQRVHPGTAISDDLEDLAISGDGVARAEPEVRLGPGARVELTPTLTKMHFFDPHTEEAIW